ncbi:hypothetical protein BDZ91DRAFT_767950 [Kalaharituber pfeilii]|nr:hypothetical protein BDZ91DRAFT_767950 [Kalaharituber pfeilii]
MEARTIGNLVYELLLEFQMTYMDQITPDIGAQNVTILTNFWACAINYAFSLFSYPISITFAASTQQRTMGEVDLIELIDGANIIIGIFGLPCYGTKVSYLLESTSLSVHTPFGILTSFGIPTISGLFAGPGGSQIQGEQESPFLRVIKRFRKATGVSYPKDRDLTNHLGDLSRFFTEPFHPAGSVETGDSDQNETEIPVIPKEMGSIPVLTVKPDNCAAILDPVTMLPISAAIPFLESAELSFQMTILRITRTFADLSGL